jgi:hypothetical protein
MPMRRLHGSNRDIRPQYLPPYWGGGIVSSQYCFDHKLVFDYFSEMHWIWNGSIGTLFRLSFFDDRRGVPVKIWPFCETTANGTPFGDSFCQVRFQREHKGTALMLQKSNNSVWRIRSFRKKLRRSPLMCAVRPQNSKAKIGAYMATNFVI